jgi:hypothetical protein
MEIDCDQADTTTTKNQHQREPSLDSPSQPLRHCVGQILSLASREQISEAESANVGAKFQYIAENLKIMKSASEDMEKWHKTTRK